MTDYFVLLGDFLLALPTFLLNGLLAVIYWLADAGAAVCAILCALAMARFADARVQDRAQYRPTRAGRAPEAQQPRTAQVTTIFVLGLWLVCSSGCFAPIPWLGAAMWMAGTLAVLVMRVQAGALLWSVKSGIAVYALAVLGSRAYLSHTSRLSPEQWAALIGSSESAAAVLSSTRSNVTTIILWALWLVIPLGYFAMLLQQLLANPLSLVHPFAGAVELIRRYRARR